MLMKLYTIPGISRALTHVEVINGIESGTLTENSPILDDGAPAASVCHIKDHVDFKGVKSYDDAVAAAKAAKSKPATTTSTTTTTAPATSNSSWLRTAGAVVLGLLGLWFLFALVLPALGMLFGTPSVNMSKGAIAEARAEAAEAKKDAAEAKKAADEAKAAAALADAKAKGASAEARTVSQINLCPGGSKAACFALLKADGLSDLGADEGCAPTCVVAGTP